MGASTMLLPRRDPPLQQGPAGRAAARGRGGPVTLIGATTENPYFEVNSALISRLQVIELEPLSAEEVGGLLRRAIDAGDRRSATRSLDFLAGALGRRRPRGAERPGARGRAPAERGRRWRSPRTRCSARRSATTRAGDQHYDLISAWIKATRGAIPTPSLYYLAVMLEGGEDPRFIVRRMVILASEDVGNADPAGARSSGRRGRGGRARRDARGDLRAGAVRDLPLACAEVQRRPSRRSWRRAAHVREHGAQPPPVTLRPGMRGEGYDVPASASRPGLAAGAAPCRPGGDPLLRARRDGGAVPRGLAEIRRARGRG